MNSENFRVVMISIFTAINFLIGILIGVKLYSVTSESSSDKTSVENKLSTPINKTNFNGISSLITY